MMPGQPTTRTVLVVVGAFLFAALPHLAAMPPWIAAMIVAAAAWRITIAVYDLRRPNWLLRTLITFGGLAVVVAHYGMLWGRRAATVLLCVMIAAKLSEMFRLRDARVVAALGYFLIATQFLFSQELLLFGYLVAGCWLITAALYRVQQDADAGERADPDPQTRLPSLRGSLVLIALAAPFAIVMFTLFPRLSSPLWGMPEEALDGRTGLSDEMTPGSIANLVADDSPAFRVEFDGPPPPPSRQYWRGPVLLHFDGRTWRELDYAWRRPERMPRPDSGAIAYTVQLEPSERRWLFALDYPVRAPEDARITADFEVLHERPVTTLMSYSMISQPDFVDTPELPDRIRDVALHLPEGSNPRTQAHARRLRERYPDDLDLIRAVMDWFNTEAFYYSLETVPLGRHGADEFLFDLRTGYCEYYASAFAVLMRAAGIPTRIVTGYQGGFWQSADEYLLVRHSDAHAWNEVWLPERGWTRVDPTSAVAPERVSEGARSAMSGGRAWFGEEWMYALRNQYDRLQHLWNQWVLDFDSGRQGSLLDWLGLGDLGSGARAAVLVALAALVLLPLTLLLYALARRSPRAGPLERRWRRICRRVGRAGVRLRPGETPSELARRAFDRLRNGDELAKLAAEYSILRYGPEPTAERVEAFFRRAGHFKPRAVNHGRLRKS